MSVLMRPVSNPNSEARNAKDRTFALWIMFLLGRHATFGQEPPISFCSITAVRWPDPAIVQARYFPDSPLPSTRMS
jgi:hypothetical protein